MHPENETKRGRAKLQPGLVPTVAAYSVIALLAILSIEFVIARSLSDITTTATATRDLVLPAIIARQRTAVNLERLGRFAETIFRTEDADSRREFQLTARILSQDAVFEEDEGIKRQAANAYTDIAEIVRLRNAQDAIRSKFNDALRNFLPGGPSARAMTSLANGNAMAALLFSAPQASSLESLAGLQREFARLEPQGTLSPEARQILDDAHACLALRTEYLVLGKQAMALWRNVNDALEQTSDSLSINAATTADERFTSIAGLADNVMWTGIAAAGALVMALGVLLFFAQRDIVVPILRYVHGLERIAQGERGLELPRARLKELDSIRSAVARSDSLMTQLAQRTHEMQATNEALESEIDVRRRTEKDLAVAKERAEAADRAKSDFLAGMSHEIRTPMNTILGMADLMLETELTPSQRQYIEVFQSSGEMLLGIINNVLDLSKIEAGEVRFETVPIDIPAFLERTREIVDSRARQKGLEFRMVGKGDIPARIVGDPVRLRQILVNLIDNGVKFTERGAVTLTLERPPGGPPGRLTFTVTDTGIGIPQQVQDQIFLRFTQADASTTRKYGGTGLGLAISRRLVEFMGGTITLTSEPERGSSFAFTLDFSVDTAPVPHPVQDAGKAEDVTARLAVTNCAILVAEDSDSNQALIELYFKDTACRLDFAADGNEAVEKFTAGRYDLVLMDIQMPGMDGYEATRRIRAFEMTRGGAPTPIVAVTANAFQEDQAQCLAAGCSDYLAKPVSKGALLSRVARHLNPTGTG
jgi:signal transduction histidine kinase